MALSLRDLFSTTLSDISGNWVRSGLTALGIFMGTAAISATLNIEAITQDQLQQKIAERDQPFLTISVYDTVNYTAPADLEDYLRTLVRDLPSIRDISTVKDVYVENVQYEGNVSDNPQAVGVSENYLSTTGRRILQGRFFGTQDFEAYRPVAIVDEVLAQQLFEGDPSPLGKGIYAQGVRLTVVGITETKKWWETQDPKGTLWVTNSYASLFSGRNRSGRPQLALTTLQDYQQTEEAVEERLKQRYSNHEVWVWGNARDLYKEDQQQRITNRLLQVSGILALVIGGVGIANITIATIMERTREIGLRRAIGATDLEVMAQFIAEAALISLIGGTAAVVTVHFLTKTASSRVFDAPYEFNLEDAAISMGAAFAVGVGSSFLPALRITQIDVVQALRGE